MTKHIRIENADNSTYKIIVYVEYLKDGKWYRSGENTTLDYPTSMYVGTIYKEKRLVVEEYT